LRACCSVAFFFDFLRLRVNAFLGKDGGGKQNYNGN
jgi:hypothetical protein